VKIIELRAENFKRLSAVAIRPDASGALVEITGANGEGKSSVLDAILFALAGAKGAPVDPIRHGADKTEVELDLGDLKVRKVQTEKGTTLTVTNADGAKYPKAQAMLDALLGDLTFDPLAFVTMPPKQRLEVLRGIVTLDVDLDAIDRAIASDYAERTAVGRMADEARAKVAALGEPVQGAPYVDEQPILGEVAALKSRRDVLADRQSNVTALRLEVANEQNQAAACEQHIALLRAQIAEIEKRRDQHIAQATAKAAEASVAVDVTEVDAVKAALVDAETRLTVAREANAAARQAHGALEKFNAAHAEADKYAAMYERLTDRIDTARKMKVEALERAVFPVPGLSFGDGDVSLDAVPFSQASTAQQILASFAIACAMNPKLKIVLVRHGSLLDDRSLVQLSHAAHDAGYQVWIERVDTTGRVGFVIEDGTVIAAPSL
jgi:DNA repair exonuclease SbcCD ATPase subunit